MSIKTIYRVEIEIPEDVHEKYSKTPEYERRSCAATEGSIEAGSEFYCECYEWATFNNRVEARKCEEKLIELRTYYVLRFGGVFPYSLTLSKGMRMAIDWVGHRYAHGDEFRSVLAKKCEWFPHTADWDDDCDITFGMAEHVTWEIKELLEQDNMACFNEEFCERLNEFMDKIV